MDEDRPSKNGNQLRDYRIDKLEDIALKHEERMRGLEDFVTRENAQGVPVRTIFLIAGVVATIIGGIIVAILKAMGLA